ncbi:MAG: hypothetical protein ACTSYZ_08105 [Candidatus Helarchaeota archaeon]
MKQDFSNNHSIYGIGSQLKTIIKSNKTHLISGTIKDSKLNPDRKFNFEVDNNNWNLTFNNFTIENIKSNSTKYIVDNYPSIFIENNIYNTFVWTSIKIPVNCILNSVEIFVQETNVTNGPAWYILTYNASRDPVTFLVMPDSLISLVSEKIAYNPSIPDLNQRRAAHWELFPCDNTGGNALLDINNTYRDTYGNGYYFICVIMPRKTSVFDIRYLYLNSDKNDEDKSYLFAGTLGNVKYEPADLCLVVNISPVNNRPAPSEIGLGIENLLRPSTRIDTIENETTEILGYVYNISGESKCVSQNFTFDQKGVLNNISLYLSFNNSYLYQNILYVGIVADTGLGYPEISDSNPIIDIGAYLFPTDGYTDQWITFTMFEQPRLMQGKYWWLLLGNTTNGANISVKGRNDTNGNYAIALNGTVFQNNTMIWHELNGDFACKVGWHPGFDVIPFKDIIYKAQNITVEDQISNKCISIRNITSTEGKYSVAAQNFTIPVKNALLNNITIRIKSTYNNTPMNMMVFPDNGTGNGPNIKKLLMYSVGLPSTTSEIWYTFNFEYLNGVEGGNYWWVLIAYTNNTDPMNNITIFGVNDTINGDNAIALNGSIGENCANFSKLSVDYACTIGWQRAPKGRWVNDTPLYPSEDKKYHYTIKSRWMGGISFDLNITNTIKSTFTMDSQYTFDYDLQNKIKWNISTNLEVPANFVESSINITKPLDWKVLLIKKETNNYSNYKISSDNKSIIIKDVSNGSWSVLAQSNNYMGHILIYKNTGTSYIPASEIQIYDKVRINATIYGQNSGTVKLGIYYPSPNNFTHYETYKQLDVNGNATFDWDPELDPLAIGGRYSIIIEWQNGTEISFQATMLNILPTPTNLTIIENFTRFPYINDTTQFIIINYKDAIRGYNISGALLNVSIFGPRKKVLEWDDLYSITKNESKRGLYKIKIDTTNLPINNTYYIRVQAEKTGYDMGLIQNIPLQIKPVPVQLISDVDNITQYIHERINFKCSFKDTFHKADIDWGHIEYRIENTSLHGNFTLAMPGESIYESGTITLTGENITGNKNYKINVIATAENCSTATISINLMIKEKTQTKIILNPQYVIPTEKIEGQSLSISVFLINSTNDMGLVNKTIKFSFGGKIPARIAKTDANGLALVEIIIPSGINSLDIFIEYEGSVETYSSTYNSPITVNIISIWEYFGRFLLWGIIGAAILTAMVITYKYTISKPRIARKIKRLTKISNKFKDIANLQFLMVVHKNAGASIFNYPISETEFDPVLVSGFFTAISAFESELSKKGQEEGVSEGFELSYSKYKILVMDGNLTRVALITEATASEEIRQKLKEFQKQFEQIYYNELVNFRGNVAVFKTAGDIVKEVFDLYLTYPQVFTQTGNQYLQMIENNKPIKDLSKLEIALIKIISSIMKTRGINYFFIPLVISMAKAARTEPDIEIIGGIYNLIQRKIIEPVEFK